jgi:hypothetical protein
MDATHWINLISHTLQQGTQTLTAGRPLADLFTRWVPDVSIAALAAAVVTLGCVMLLELRALSALRGSMDAHLARVFEQLDLIRFDHVQLLESHARIAAAIAAAPPAGAQAERPITLTSSPKAASTSAALAAPAIAAGEARLLASLAEARARRAAECTAPAARTVSAR